MLSDNGSGYRSRIVAAMCRALDVAQRWTRPYRPQTNGKAERFIQTLLREWAYSRAYSSSLERQAALPRYLHITIGIDRMAAYRAVRPSAE